jgi:SsrA-binding protein
MKLKLSQAIMILAQNKKAFFDYFVIETYQAGLVLSGKMVKQIRAKKVNLQGRYIVHQQQKLQILDFGNQEISENITLLINQKEMTEILKYLNIPGYTCIPLNIKTIGRWIKAEIAVVKGKKNYDKRQTLKEKDLQREEVRGIL